MCSSDLALASFLHRRPIAVVARVSCRAVTGTVWLFRDEPKRTFSCPQALWTAVRWVAPALLAEVGRTAAICRAPAHASLARALDSLTPVLHVCSGAQLLLPLVAYPILACGVIRSTWNRN